MKIKLIACDVLTRELSLASSRSLHVIDSVFLPFGLHSTPSLLRERLQEEIDAADCKGYDYIALGYGLCSRGTAELAARSVPLVITRAHDCITLFLGSRSRYSREFIDNPGTYYYSPGWIERSEGEIEQGYISDQKEKSARERYLEYVEKYGEDNARFLLDQEQQWLSHYSRAAFLDTGVGTVDDYRAFTQRIAASHGWEYQEVEGDTMLIERIVNADWSGDDFIIVQPGQRIVESFDEKVLDVGEAMSNEL